MAKGLGDKLVLAISSRALFDLSESHKVYLSSGVEAYRQYQIEHEDEILAPGDAFPLVEKLLSLNSRLGRARANRVERSERRHAQHPGEHELSSVRELRAQPRDTLGEHGDRGVQAVLRRRRLFGLADVGRQRRDGDA